MKSLLFASIVLCLAGCAGTPPPAAPVAGTVDVTAPEKVDQDAIMAAQESGQRVVQEDGQTLICRREKQTGSRLRTQTTCMTAEDWKKATEASRQTVQDMARQRPPPQGN